MRLRLFLPILIFISLQSPVCAQEKVNVEDRLIGFTFKALAKTFVATTDANKLKKNNIEKLKKMDEEKFRRRYAEAYAVIKSLPEPLKANFGVTENMTKERVIKDIEFLDKKKLYEIIDSVPDSIIAGQFKLYLAKKQQEIQKSNLVEQINKFWNKVIEKIGANKK